MAACIDTSRLRNPALSKVILDELASRGITHSLTVPKFIVLFPMPTGFIDIENKNAYDGENVTFVGVRGMCCEATRHVPQRLVPTRDFGGDLCQLIVSVYSDTVIPSVHQNCAQNEYTFSRLLRNVKNV